MGRNSETSAVVDGLLELLVTGSTLSVVILAPNAVQALDKPLKLFFDKMDKNQRSRELKRLTRYMEARGLVKDSYEHGLIITKAGQERAKQTKLSNLQVATPPVWDKRWRLVLFDIPEKNSSARNALTSLLKQLGFHLLQQSVWIHPFPCREQVQTVCLHYDVAQWVSYIETSHIDHEEILIKRFSKILK